MSDRGDSRHWTETHYLGGGTAVRSRSLIHVMRAAAQPRRSRLRRMASAVARKVSEFLGAAAK